MKNITAKTQFLRKIVWLIFAILFSQASLVTVAQASSVTIGLTGMNGGNGFPFGSRYIARYQQVYDSSQFSGSMTIGEIDFFNTLGLNDQFSATLNSGAYTFSLSTTAMAVNALDTVNLNNNLGPDNALFTVAVLSGGSPPSKLSFTGNPFTYNPANGNLLLDIQGSGISHNIGSSGARFDADNGSAGGVFSRAMVCTASCTGTANYGLVTEFASPVPVPTSLYLFSSGLTALVAWRRKIALRQ